MIPLDWDAPFKEIGAIKTPGGITVNPDKLRCPMCGANLKLIKWDMAPLGWHELTFKCPDCPTTTITEVDKIYKRTAL